MEKDYIYTTTDPLWTTDWETMVDGLRIRSSDDISVTAITASRTYNSGVEKGSFRWVF